MMQRLLVLAAVLLLVACQTPTPASTDVRAQRDRLQNLDSFRVTGGLGVWTEKESISARIEWQQLGQDFDLLIRLPAGLSSVRVTQQAAMASLQKSGAARVTGPSASRLLQQALGLQIAVPVEQMAFWIRGLPGSEAQAVRYDQQGRLQSMQYVDQQNTRWRAKVLKFSSFDGTTVPATLLANGGPYTVRLVLKKWSKAVDGDLTGPNAGQSSDTGKAKDRLSVPGR